jgi:hypothetical protein
MAPALALKFPIFNKISIGFWIAGILFGVVQAASGLYQLSTDDAVAYLDVADLYLKGDWVGAVNGNWSPLYSWLLALALGIFQPTSAWEYPLLKLVNFLIYVLAFASFEFLLREILWQIHNPESYSTHERRNLNLIPTATPKLEVDSETGGAKNLRFTLRSVETIWLALAYALFIFTSLCWIGLNCDTPDMSTTGLIYLATGLILRIKRQPQRWLNFLLLGVVLAFGYFSKAAMFLVGFIFILISLCSTENFSKGLTKAIAALLVFLLISAPYITALSIKKGFPTFSETGKFSYVTLVYPGHYKIPDKHWQGSPPGFGTPKHPTRQIFDHPDVFEFAEPIHGTYAPWVDPTYWYEGITPQFNLVGLGQIAVKNAVFYFKNFLGLFAVSYLILLYCSDRRKIMLKSLLENWQMLAIAITGLGLYMVATDFVVNNWGGQPSTRFIAAFVVVLFCGISPSIKFSTVMATKRVSKLLVLAITVALLFNVGSSSVRGFHKIRRESNFYANVAIEIGKLGVKQGDQVAILGDEKHVYWARLARVRIIAQLPEVKEFWQKDATTKGKILNKFKQAGAIAVVQLPHVDFNDSSHSWQEVGKTGYHINLLKD